MSEISSLTLPFLCTCRCAGVSLCYASPVGFTLCSSCVLSMWQALCHIAHPTGCCSACLQSSPLHIRQGSQFLLLLNSCNFCFNPLVNHQVSEPYWGTAFTFDSKTPNLLLVVSTVPQHCQCLLDSHKACLDIHISASLLAQTDIPT